MAKWVRASAVRMGRRFIAVSRRSGRMRLSVAVALAVAVGAALAVVAEAVLIAVFHPARAGVARLTSPSWPSPWSVAWAAWARW